MRSRDDMPGADSDQPLPRRAEATAGAPPVARTGQAPLIATAVVALVIGGGVGYLIGHKTSVSVSRSPFGQAVSIGAVRPGDGAPTAAATAALGATITKGSLQIEAAGPPVVVKDGSGAGLEVTFQITMRNTSGSGHVDGPGSFGIRCDANRADGPGGDWVNSTALNKTIQAGQSVTGTAVVSWLDWNKSTKCTGPTTLEADWIGTGFVAWTLPDAVVAQVNAAVG